jgi:hypothetical protein
MVLSQSGKLPRKPRGEASGHESKLYWQVPASEPRIMLVFLAGNKEKISGLTQQFARLFFYHGFGNASFKN